MERLRISVNKRFFVKENGQPFIWLADTCWTLPQRLKWDDVEYYMEKRKQQGFTVLQIVVLDPEQDEHMRNPSGEPALLEDDLSQPNEAYFTYLDKILERAAFYGFYVLLLPAWGELVVGHNWMGEFSRKKVNPDNAYAYGQWLGARYQAHPHVIWCLGGDRMPIHLGVDYKQVWRLMAEGLAKGVLNVDLQYNVPDPRWAQVLMTYHACYEAETGECSTMSYWTDEEAWISFIMIQSGHGLKIKNYDMVAGAYNRPITMPVFDGEPAYEMMPTSWPVITTFHGDWIVRKRAYWSLFAGAFGHTYGHSSVWCMISEKEKNHVRQCSWFEALEQPGAQQIQYIRDFLEVFDLSRVIPAQEILLSQLKASEHAIDEHKQACRDQEGLFACIYMPSGGKEMVDIHQLAPGNIHVWWYSPKIGLCYTQENHVTTLPARTFSHVGSQSKTTTLSEQVITLQSPTNGAENDWICVLQNDLYPMLNLGVHGTYGEIIEKGEVKKVFEW